MPNPFSTDGPLDEEVTLTRRELSEELDKRYEVLEDTGQLLNPYDPFDAVLIQMVKTNRAKRRDYALDGDIFSNFTDVASNLGLEGFGALESAYTILLNKVARLKSLRQNGRMDDPSNESVMDTYLDLAVYATICLALVNRGTD